MIIKKYSELRKICKMFPKKKAELIILVSKGGLGKSTLIRNMMGKRDYLMINSKSTALQTYMDLYNRKDKYIHSVFDDINDLLKSSIQVSLLKSYCDLEEVKTLHYHSTSPLLNGYEQSCKVKGNAFIILNQFNVKNNEMKPLMDRGFTIFFEPSNSEIYREIERIAKKDNRKEVQEILLFLKEHLNGAKNISIRSFVKGCQLYSHDKKTWKKYLLKEIEYSKEYEIINSNLKNSEKVKKLAELDDSDINYNSKLRKYQRMIKKECN